MRRVQRDGRGSPYTRNLSHNTALPDGHRPDDQPEMNLTMLNSRFRKLFRLARHPSLWPFAFRGTVASLEHQDVPFGKDFRTVIDVGASRGQFAAFAAHRFPKARIICFEPLPGPADRLEKVLGNRVELRRIALGSKPGRATINVSARDDSSSLLPIGSRQVQEFPGTEAVDSIEVEVSTLDLELPEPPLQPCLLKIDVQGFEAEVLNGAPKTLTRTDEALIECSFVELYAGQALGPEITTLMKEEGFSTRFPARGGNSPNGSAIQADLLFVRDD